MAGDVFSPCTTYMPLLTVRLLYHVTYNVGANIPTYLKSLTLNLSIHFATSWLSNQHLNDLSAKIAHHPVLKAIQHLVSKKSINK